MPFISNRCQKTTQKGKQMFSSRVTRASSQAQRLASNSQGCSRKATRTTCGIHHSDIFCSGLCKGFLPMLLRKAAPFPESDRCDVAVLRQQSQALLGAASFDASSRELSCLILRP